MARRSRRPVYARRSKKGGVTISRWCSTLSVLAGRLSTPGNVLCRKLIWREQQFSVWGIHNTKKLCYNYPSLQLSEITKSLCKSRSVAQPGRELRSGRRGRMFESCHSDQIPEKSPDYSGLFSFLPAFCFIRGGLLFLVGPHKICYHICQVGIKSHFWLLGCWPCCDCSSPRSCYFRFGLRPRRRFTVFPPSISGISTKRRLIGIRSFATSAKR